jgi:hypothetical protein
MTQKTNINLHQIRSKRTFRNSEPAYDETTIGTPLGYGKYELRGFDDSGVEYFDSKLDRGIWSIGFETKTGRIIASLTSDLYGHPDYTCLWLR